MNQIKKILISSDQEMIQLGEKLGKNLSAGDVVELQGELGAGKTTLVKGIGNILGIKEITSPTFTISKIYNSNPKLVHIDLYRLQGSPMAFFDDLDIESYLEKSILVIEWGNHFTARISSDYLQVQIDITSENSREVTFSSNSEKFGKLVL